LGVRGLAAKAGIRPIAFGGQALILMLVHLLLTTAGDRSLTVNQLIRRSQAEDAEFPEFLEWAGMSAAQFYDYVARIGEGLLAVLLAVAFVFWIGGWRRAFRRTVLVYLALAIVSLLATCESLVSTLGQRTSETDGAEALLWDAVVTWVTNVVTFTLWYWFLDRGGPDRRRSAEPGRPDFAFPQQTAEILGWERWTPGLVDYRFLAFNTSTAFSPTDTLALSPWAKVLNMLQAGISLVIVVMLAGQVAPSSLRNRRPPTSVGPVAWPAGSSAGGRRPHRIGIKLPSVELWAACGPAAPGAALGRAAARWDRRG
jgi:hypothetical protein